MDSATVGVLVGAVVRVLLVMGGAGTLVVRRRKRPGARASLGGGGADRSRAPGSSGRRRCRATTW
jgi:hypothetical protein